MGLAFFKPGFHFGIMLTTRSASLSSRISPQLFTVLISEMLPSAFTVKLTKVFPVEFLFLLSLGYFILSRKNFSAHLNRL